MYTASHTQSTSSSRPEAIEAMSTHFEIYTQKKRMYAFNHRMIILYLVHYQPLKHIFPYEKNNAFGIYIKKNITQLSA